MQEFKRGDIVCLNGVTISRGEIKKYTKRVFFNSLVGRVFKEKSDSDGDIKVNFGGSFGIYPFFPEELDLLERP